MEVLLIVALLMLGYVLYHVRAIRENDQYYANMPYRQYLQSARWRAKREQRKAIDKWACVKCGETYGLQVHHLTYERRGRERMSDLVTLCEDCHRRVHGK